MTEGSLSGGPAHKLDGRGERGTILSARSSSHRSATHPAATLSLIAIMKEIRKFPPPPPLARASAVSSRASIGWR